MKRILTILSLLLLTWGSTMALPVDNARAWMTANRFWSTQGLKGSLTERPTEFSHLYLFAGSQGGFVVVSSDDCAPLPVMAWSANTQVGDVLPTGLRKLFAQADSLIAADAAHGAPTSEGWKVQGRKSGSGMVTTVGPLLTTYWETGQPFYSNSTRTTAGRHYVHSDAAVAMAQIMRYWEWPVTGRGSHAYNHRGGSIILDQANFGATTYDWDSMPDWLDSNSTQAQVDAVSQLLYHCDVAIEADFDTAYSNAYIVGFGYDVASVERAIVKYFKYSSNLRSGSVEGMSQEQVTVLFQSEIDAQRPLIFSYNIIDGYDSYGRFHIRECEEGYDWYQYINFASTGTYIVGIEPDTNALSAQYTISATGDHGGSVSGTGTFNAGQSTDLTAYAAPGYRFSHWSDGTPWNPRYTDVYGDKNLTAHFVRVAANDTLQWDNGVRIGQWDNLPGSTGAVTFADSLLAGHTQLTGVMYYPVNLDTHIVTVRQGGTLLWSDTVVPTHRYEWLTLYPASGLPLGTGDLQLIINASSIAAFPYHGGSDTVAIGEDTLLEVYNTFPLRAIVDGLVSPYTLTVQSDDFWLGTVTGSGAYAQGSTATITAVPRPGAEFVRWNDGNTNNPRVVTLTSDTTFTAEFISVTTSVWVEQQFWSDNGTQAFLGNTDLLYYELTEGWHDIEVPSTVGNYKFTHWQDWDEYGQYRYDTVLHKYISGDNVYLTAYYYLNPVYLDLGVNDSALGTLDRHSGYASRDALINVYAAATHPNAFVTGWSAPEPFYGGPWIPRYDVGWSSSSDDVFSWPDTVQITAFFDTLHADTLCYYPLNSNRTALMLFRDDNPIPDADYIQWAVKYDGSAFRTNHYIRKIQLFAYPDFHDTLRIYQGGDDAPGTLLHTQVLDFTGIGSYARTWWEATLDTFVQVADTSCVWVVLSSGDTNSNGARPCGHLHYTGNPNSSLLYVPGEGWVTPKYGANGNYIGTWAVRLITGPNNRPYCNVSVWSQVYGGDECCDGEYIQGDRVTLTATPYTGYRFSHWNWQTSSSHGATASNPVTFTVNSDISYGAYYVHEVTLTLHSNNDDWGTVSGGGVYGAGESVRIRATANSGYQFVRWSDGNTSSTRNITVDNNMSLTATFAPRQYTLTLRANHDEWGDVTGGGTYDYGSSVPIAATPAEGYRFDHWSDNDTHSHRTVTIEGDRTLTAYFAQNASIGRTELTNVVFYPNPASRSVTVEGLTGRTETTVVDLAGRPVLTCTLDSDNREIDISRLPVGAYFVHFQTPAATTVRKLIVK